jgi:DinB superfamily
VSDVRGALLGVYDEARRRLALRLEGLSDDEYLWEPVSGCWSVREGADGAWIMDGAADAPAPPPFTTIAWRTCHLGGHVLGGFANWLNGNGSPFAGDVEVPRDADGALEFLERNGRYWRDGMETFPSERLWRVIGPEFGPYAEATAVDLVLHVIDEFIHHGAEISLMRDLYLRMGPPAA